MRRLLLLSLLACLSAGAFAAAPPAKAPAAWLKLIDQLGDQDDAVRESAEVKLRELGEDVLPALRRARRDHADADVRLRATVLAAAIEKSPSGPVRRFRTHEYGVVSFALSPDGKRLVTGTWKGRDNVARVWDVETGKEVLQLKGHTDRLYCVDWSKDGKSILTGSIDQTLILWDAKTGKRLKTLSGSEGSVYHVSLTPDGKRAISCDGEAVTRVWDLEKAKTIALRRDHNPKPPGARTVVAMPDGKHFVRAGFDGSVRILEVETCKEVRTMDGKHEPGSVQIAVPSADGKRIASAGEDGVVRLWDAGTGKLVEKFTGHEGLVLAVCLSSDGKRLLSGGHDRTVRLWDVESGKEIQRIDFAHEQAASCVAFLPGGRRAITAGYDRDVKIWNLRK